MASIIPKIKIGLAASKREKHNLSFDCSTTSNIGSIQPTMCREMVPKATYKVKTSNLVRLASMPCPTFGRISYRHYHKFVPMSDIWQPFDCMMAGQHYQGYDTNPWVPTIVPNFKFTKLVPRILRYCDVSIAYADQVNRPFTVTNTTTSWNGTVYETVGAAQEADKAIFTEIWSAIHPNSANYFENLTIKLYGDSSVPVGSLEPESPGVIRAGGWYAVKSGNLGNSLEWHINADDTPITATGADWVTNVTIGNVKYAFLFRFKAPVKRLRTIFLGLGYSFSPYDENEYSLLKLLAYYKAWFDTFAPKRERAFNDTTCYEIIKKASNRNDWDTDSTDRLDLVLDLINDLMFECYYYLPMDYYSMSVIRPANGNQDTSLTLNTGYSQSNNTLGGVSPGSNSEITLSPQVSTMDGSLAVKADGTSTFNNPMAVKLAMKMLTWAHKNTIIGRRVRDYLRVHHGITEGTEVDNGDVIHIGQSRTNIQISDIMSTAESKDGYLGEYGGRGIGYNDNETISYTAKEYGYWITLSVVVPESGYYQGYLKENRHLRRFNFFMPEFDAAGYQVLERGEIMNDYNMDCEDWKPKAGYNRQQAFGFVPRYSEYKVGRNIVNGDLSLPSLYDSMSPYTLDRRLSTGKLEASAQPEGYNIEVAKFLKPNFVPSVVFDDFRRIDPSDNLGQYNRMFNYVSNDLDHFIIHTIFDVEAYMPMKSLSESFETINSGEETTEMIHA